MHNIYDLVLEILELLKEPNVQIRRNQMSVLFTDLYFLIWNALDEHQKQEYVMCEAELNFVKAALNFFLSRDIVDELTPEGVKAINNARLEYEKWQDKFLFLNIWLSIGKVSVCQASNGKKMDKFSLRLFECVIWMAEFCDLTKEQKELQVLFKQVSTFHQGKFVPPEIISEASEKAKECITC